MGLVPGLGRGLGLGLDFGVGVGLGLGLDLDLDLGLGHCQGLRRVGATRCKGRHSPFKTRPSRASAPSPPVPPSASRAARDRGGAAGRMRAGGVEPARTAHLRGGRG